MTKVSIYQRMDDGRWLWAGAGQLRGNQIVDCAADIGDAVYGALEGAIEYDTQTDAPVNGSYERTVEGGDWRVDVEEDNDDVQPSRDPRDICARLSAYDDGHGILGIIVRQALRDNPSVTDEEIIEIIRESREQAEADREWDNRK